MPLLDFVTPQPSFRNQLYSIRFQRIHHGAFLFSNENTPRLGFSWRNFCIPNKANNIIYMGSFVIRRGSGHMIKAAATLEPKCSDKENGNVQQLGIDSTRSLPATEILSSRVDSTLDEKQRLIRMKISKAMKGKTPWNKGRKHSPETLQRIRERTRIAMQDPKIRMKVAVNLGLTLSEETKLKIKAGVRLYLDRRREKQMVQETCHFEWQNLIAEASRKGFCGEEELQWDSYKNINEQLDKEWIESIEHRKRNRPKGVKRGPLSPEYKRKISETLLAKWETDPSYRDRVYTGLSKYYGKTVGIGKPRRSRKPRKTNPKSQVKTEANASTKLLIAEATRAADAEEIAAAKDLIAQSSVIEIRKTNPKSQVKSEAIKRTKLLTAENKRAAHTEETAAATDLITQASAIETRKTNPERQVKSKSIKRTRLSIAEAKRAAYAEAIAAARDRITQSSVIKSRKTKPKSQVKSEAIKRTKLLIAENEKANDAVEIAAAKGTLDQASVIDTKKTNPESQGKTKAIEGTKLLVAEAKRSVDAEEIAAASNPMAQASAIETRMTNPEKQVKSEVIKRTKLLIAEAKRAADAKEIAAARDPVAQAEVIETRKLIAKAIAYIESLEAQGKQAASHEHGTVGGKFHLSTTSDDLSSVPPPHVSKKTKKWVRGKLVEVDEDD